MGVINIEGLGPVNIKGEQPTPEESRVILKAAETKRQESMSNSLPSATGEVLPTSENITKSITDPETEVSKFLSSPEFKRLLIEVGAGTALATATGGWTAPATVARVAMLSRPFLTSLAARSAAAGVGGGIGAVAAQSIDPKDDMVKEIVRAAAENSIGEGVGGLLVKGVEKAIAPGVKLLRGADDAVKTIEEQRKIIQAGKATFKTAEDKTMLDTAAKEGFLTPGLTADNNFIDILQNISKNSFLGSKGLENATKGAETIAKSGLDDFVSGFINTQDRTATGQLFQHAITNNRLAFDTAVAAKYNNVDQLLGKTVIKDSATGLDKVIDKTIIDTTPYKKVIAAKIADLETVAGGKADPGALDLLKTQLSIPDKTNFTTLNAYRQKLLQVGRQATPNEINKQSFYDAYHLLNPQITKLTEEAAGKINPKALEAYKEANQFYKAGVQDFNDKTIVNLLEKNPELVFKEIIRAGDQPTLVKDTFDIINRRFNAVGSTAAEKATAEDLKTSLKGEFLRKIIGDSSERVGQYNTVNANKIANYIGPNGRYEMTAKTLLEPKEYDRVMQLQNALAFAQGKIKETGPTPGSLFFQFKQAGAAGAILGLGGYQAYQGNIAPALGIVLAPKAIGYALTSPTFVKNLTKTIESTNPTIQGTAFRQAITHLMNGDLVDAEEGRRAIKESYDLQKQAVREKKMNTITNQPRTEITPSAAPVSKISEGPTTPNVNMFAANTQAQTPSGQVQAPQALQGQPSNFTNIPQDQLNKYTTLFGKVV